MARPKPDAVILVLVDGLTDDRFVVDPFEPLLLGVNFYPVKS